MFLIDNIDFAESENYILSIRLIPNGFYFSIHNPSDKSVFYQNNITFPPHSQYLKNLEKLIFDYSFFSNNYKKIYVISVDEETTLVPNELYDKSSEASILSFNYLAPKSHIISNNIKAVDCKVIWGIDEKIHSFLSRALLNPDFTSHLFFLIPFFHKQHNIETNTLFINFNDSKMVDIIGFAKEKLIIAKTFTTKNQLEASYYIQKTWESLLFNTETDKLYFSGKEEENSECINTIKKVIPKAESMLIELPNIKGVNMEETPVEILNQLCE